MELNRRNTSSSFPRGDDGNCESFPSSDDLEDKIPEAVQLPGTYDSEQQALKFKARHIQMMALGFSLCRLFLTLGSALASSLFLQMSKVLYLSGPVSMLLANLHMGMVALALVVGFLNSFS